MSAFQNMAVCIAIVLLAVLFTAVGCGQKKETPTTVVEQPKQTEQTEQPAEKPIEAATYQEWLQQTVEREIGQTTNTGASRINDIYFFDAEEKNVYISLNADENMTENTVKDGILVDSHSVFAAIFKDPRAEEVSLEWCKGNVVITNITLKRQTAEKLKATSPLGLPGVADKYTTR